MDHKEIAILNTYALQIRRDIVEMIGPGRGGHLGGACSIAEILAVLYFHTMIHDASQPLQALRDRFILSKGHGALALYSALSQAGYFPRQELFTLKALGSRLQGHPVVNKLPGIEASTGSLGQGLSVACGLAAGLRLSQNPSRVYCLIGDGETNEGQIWEAAISACSHRLDRLTAIIDCNGYQACGPVTSGLDAASMAQKWQAFGWAVQTIDGQDVAQIVQALDDAQAITDRPYAIIARTTKGAGLPFGTAHTITLSDPMFQQALACTDPDTREATSHADT